MLSHEVSEILKNYTIRFNSISTILTTYPLSDYAKLFCRYPYVASYHYMSTEVINLTNEIRTRSTESILHFYNQLLLIYLIHDNIIKLDSSNIPPNIKSLYHNNFKRIISNILSDKEPLDFYMYSNDKFLKDLGVCTLRLIPVGHTKIHLSKFPIKSLFKHDVHQFIKVLLFVFFELKGVQPLYQLHIDSHDPDLLKEFNAEGRIRSYQNIADLLKINKDVKGVYGIAWLHDPVLKTISPRLSFLKEIGPNNGSKTFNMGTNNDAIMNAIATSPTRRRLYHEGKYTPTDFLFVWPRKSLIHWAEESCSPS
jgi:hypothetical protein